MQRGAVLTLPGRLQPTTLIDLKLRLVAAAPAPIEQQDELSPNAAD